MPTVTHVAVGLDGGGASRSVLEMCRVAPQIEPFTTHQIFTLRQPASSALAEARALGVVVKFGAELERELAQSDIIQVEYFNHPLILRFLSELALPARLLIWCHVAGDAPPNVLTSELASFADLVVTTSQYSRELPVFAGVPNVRFVHEPTSEARALALLQIPFRHRVGTTVGYVGTVDFVKMHRRFAPMHCQIPADPLRVIICGAPAFPDSNTIETLKREAEAFGRTNLLEFRGYVPDVHRSFAEFDVYGYPLCSRNYASAELNLQEAMYAGLASVVLNDGAVGSIVDDAVTGRVVDSEDAYAAAVAELLTDPAERVRLGERARDHAMSTFGSRDAAVSMQQLYNELMCAPKRSRSLPVSADAKGVTGGAALFLTGLGEVARPFIMSLSSDNGERLRGEQHVRELCEHPTMGSIGFGSPRHYLRYFPEDELLRRWVAISRH